MTSPIATWIVVHDLGRSGVPMALLRMLRWHRAADLGARGLGEIHVVAEHGGELAGPIAEAAASLTVLEPGHRRSWATTAAVASSQLGVPAPGSAVRSLRRRQQVRGLPRPDALIVHGAGAWPTWESLAPAAGDPWVALHLHELSVGLRRSVPSSMLGRLRDRPDVIAAVCEPDDGVRQVLGRRADDVAIVPGCVELPADAAPEPDPGPSSQVVAVGEAGWRKGTDRFVAIAHQLGPSLDATFRWIGRPLEQGWTWAPGGDGPVSWTAPRDDPWSDVAPGSVVVVASREDPLPLVALEAAARRHRVVAAATGGLPALLADRRGWCVDGWDLDALGDAVRAAATGDDAAERAARLHAYVAEHLTAAAVGPRWVATLGPT